MKKFLLYLVALAVGFHAHAAMTDYQNWMAGLDDDAFICQLSIPGVNIVGNKKVIIK